MHFYGGGQSEYRAIVIDFYTELKQEIVRHLREAKPVSNVFDKNENNIFKINEALSQAESKITGHDYGMSAIAGDSSDNPRPAAAVAVSGASNVAESKTINTLQQITANSDFMDISRAELDVSGKNSYPVSPPFSYGNFDIDSFDCVSIKMPDADFSLKKEDIDWPSIFAAIERSSQDPFAQDFLDDINDMEYRPVRSGITLVKGKSAYPAKGQYSNDEPESRNTVAFDHDQLAQLGKSLNIPVNLYIENGELVLKANLSGLDLGDLQRMTRLPSMRSVLYLITR